MQQPDSAAVSAAAIDALQATADPKAEETVAASAGHAPATAVLLPLPAGHATNSGRMEGTAAGAQQGCTGSPKAGELQAPCNLDTGSSIAAAAAPDIGDTAGPAKPVLKRRRVLNAFKAPRAASGQENAATLAAVCARGGAVTTIGRPEPLVIRFRRQ
jgi:hypothetical protein